MFRKQVSPKAVAVVVIAVLAAVQGVYWRMLVYQPHQGSGPMAGGGAPPPSQTSLGLESVTVERFVGSVPGYEDGPAWKARFNGPNALALDRDGSLLVADSRNHRIRRVAMDGRVITVAGASDPNGPGGSVLGAASAAEFSFPSGVAVAKDGSVYISDPGNGRVCVLKDGQVSRFASYHKSWRPTALIQSPDGRLWTLDATLSIQQISPQGVVSSPASVPGAVADALGKAGAKSSVAVWPDPWTEPEATSHAVGLASASLEAEGAPSVFADVENNALMLRRDGAAPALLVGRRPAGASVFAAVDGTGDRATLAGPCAVVTGADGVGYVAEFEASRIRRFRLPGWLVEGNAVSPERRRRRWRDRSGN